MEVVASRTEVRQGKRESLTLRGTRVITQVTPIARTNSSRRLMNRSPSSSIILKSKPMTWTPLRVPTGKLQWNFHNNPITVIRYTSPFTKYISQTFGLLLIFIWYFMFTLFSDLLFVKRIGWKYTINTGTVPIFYWVDIAAWRRLAL